ncbi:TPA: ABC transporter ATP-binding protein [Candidatus Bathyarchaeota archaeon]|nr:ABC transporter ATP-binding protein [Candidatus Bathyarchaeota archaeon]HIJ08766.1 ABC transporter ATP-binding protein [Candidatus Bathyarchaeota archaeon]
MIKTENLTRKFGKLTAVENLTLEVEEGEVFGFLGPNAAGKTTTIRMLCCLIAKTSGNARIGDFDVDDPEDCLKIRKIVGLLPENVGLYDSLSAYKNLDFFGKLYEVPPDKRSENIERLLTLLGIWERRDDLVGAFSKGTKQKIAIARALVHDPRLLFLDEPTANLDPEASKTVRDFIHELKKEKRTIFINTHNLVEAERLCDRIGIINTHLVTVGAPESLARGLQARKTVVHLQQADTKVLAAVEKLHVVKNVRSVDNKLVLDMDDPEKDNPEVVRTIVSAGGNVQFVTELRSTLEDVYLKMIKEGETQ